MAVLTEAVSFGPSLQMKWKMGEQKTAESNWPDGSNHMLFSSGFVSIKQHPCIAC
jgi:hypothetical protein